MPVPQLKVACLAPATVQPGRRLVLLAALGALTLAGTGCVYLRLLALQNQLADFDRYVAVRDAGDLILEFRKPVLTGEDLCWLAKLGPTSVTTNGSEQTWQWTFEKARAPDSRETGAFDMSFVTVLRSNRMSQFVIPQRFLSFMPKTMILELARAAGRADVDRRRRSAHIRWRGAADASGLFPTPRELRELLGEPFATVAERHQVSHLYRYSLKTPTPAAPEKKAAWARFDFQRNEGVLARAEAEFAGFRLKITLDTAEQALTARTGE